MNNLVDIAAFNGDANEIYLLHDCKIYGKNAVDIACQNNHRNVLEVLIKCNKYIYKFTENSFKLACQGNNWDVLYFLIANNIRCLSTYNMDYAATVGNLKLLKWLYQVGSTCSIVALSNAVANGHLNCVEFLISIRKQNIIPQSICYAAENGMYDVLNIIQLNSNVLNYACRNNQVAYCKYLYLRGYKFEKKHIHLANHHKSSSVATYITSVLKNDFVLNNHHNNI